MRFRARSLASKWRLPVSRASDRASALLMDGLRRVTFRFGTEVEVRYLPRAPEVGDYVARVGDLWVIAFVSRDLVGLTAICELHDGDDRHVRRVA